MKKLKAIICGLLVVFMLFGVTACGQDNTFKGDFKNEASADEITELTTSIKQASGTVGAIDAVADAATGFESEVDVYMKYTENGVWAESDISCDYAQQLVEGKLVYAAEMDVEMDTNRPNADDEKMDVDLDVYYENDNIYIKNGEVKKYINVGTPILGEQIANSVGEMIEGMSTDSFSEYADDILALDVEELKAQGVKVYIDKDKKFTRIKYVMDANAYAEAQSGEGASFGTRNKYEIIVVLDKDNKLYGVKVDMKIEFTYNVGEDTSALKMEVEASVHKSKEKVDLPSFRGYQKIESAEDFAELGKLFA